jgi:hypothetical protein
VPQAPDKQTKAPDKQAEAAVREAINATGASGGDTAHGEADQPDGAASGTEGTQRRRAGEPSRDARGTESTRDRGPAATDSDGRRIEAVSGRGADGRGIEDGPGPGAGGRGAGGAARREGDSGGEDSVEETVRDAISAPDAEGVPRRTTRRFPLFTRDTARPEGGGRAAPGDAPAPARQWPILAVLGVVALGLLLTALDAFRYGTLLIGCALVAGAVLRWVLPDVGMLAVRSRFTDIVTYGGLGLAIVLLALMVQPNPWLQIPFLKDTLHFTVSSS